MSFGASTERCRHCRPVISMDETFLAAKVKGTLLMACTMDANTHIFPLAFGIGDTGNDDSWT